MASAAYPLIATDFYQLLDTSDVPGGVANIVTGPPSELAPVLASHADVGAVWSFSGDDLALEIERAASGNLKRTWVPGSHDWTHSNAPLFRDAATEVKTIWVPYGE